MPLPCTAAPPPSSPPCSLPVHPSSPPAAGNVQTYLFLDLPPPFLPPFSSFSLPLYPYIRVLICRPTYLPICLSIYPSIHLSIHQSIIHRSICLSSIYPFIYPSIYLPGTLPHQFAELLSLLCLASESFCFITDLPASIIQSCVYSPSPFLCLPDSSPHGRNLTLQISELLLLNHACTRIGSKV